MFTYLALVIPPVALALDVFTRSLPEIGRADDDDLEALGPGLVASPRTGRDAHRVPSLELDDLVVELHAPAPTHDHVHLLLLLVPVAVRKAIAGRDALVAQAGLLELERHGRQAELQVRRAAEPGPEVLQILLEVPEPERHARNPTVRQVPPPMQSSASPSVPTQCRRVPPAPCSLAFTPCIAPQRRRPPSRTALEVSVGLPAGPFRVSTVRSAGIA